MTENRTIFANGTKPLLLFVFTAMFSALTAVCAWVQIPAFFGLVPFTMQTFGVFAALLFLGGKYGSLSVAVYLLLGLSGVPVFSGFRGGVGVLAGVTGGYITGFLLGALAYWGLEALFCRKSRFSLPARIFALTVCLLVCYLFGTCWFALLHEGALNAVTFGGALSTCVLPFLIPDLIKMSLALLLHKKLAPVLHKQR